MNSPYKVKHVYPHGPTIKSCDCWWGNIEYEEIDSGEQQCSSEFFLQIFYFLLCECREMKESKFPSPAPMEIETTPVKNVLIVLFLALSINLNYQNYGYNHSNQCRIICGRQVRQHRIQQ